MVNIITNPSVVLILWLSVIVCHAVWSLLKIKKLEKEDNASINCFCVYIKYKSAVHCFVIAFVMSIVCIAAYTIEVSSKLVFCMIICTCYFLKPVRQKMIIMDDQITYVNFWGTKKTFSLTSIKKMEIYNIFSPNWHLLLTVRPPDSQNDYDINFKYINYEYNNMDLLAERLKNVGAIDVDEIKNKAAILENNQYPASCKFFVSRKYGKIKFCFGVLILFVLAFLFLNLGKSIANRDYFIAVLIIVLCLFGLFDLIRSELVSLKCNNDVFEYGFAVFKKRFEIHDISHVKFLPHMNLLCRASIFLKDGKCVCTIYKDSNNFELFIDSLKCAGITLK